MAEFFLCFIPVLVAVDPIGTLPLFMGLTRGIQVRRMRKVVFQSILTALLVSFLFLAVGKIILKYLGVSVGDFMVAGGILLFLFSVVDILFFESRELSSDKESIGAVPIGVPLLAGPALITTLMLLAGEHGYAMPMLSTVIALFLTGTMLFFSRKIYSILGKTGAKTLSKLANLLLSAIAVMMIRKGILVMMAEIK
ncbi:MAG TPA: MarC family protein [Spirochaetota bacterium]|nr:MarC family protein [Spirochaetota bacterium]